MHLLPRRSCLSNSPTGDSDIDNDNCLFSVYKAYLCSFSARCRSQAVPLMLFSSESQERVFRNSANQHSMCKVRLPFNVRSIYGQQHYMLVFFSLHSFPEHKSVAHSISVGSYTTVYHRTRSGDTQGAEETESLNYAFVMTIGAIILAATAP